MDSGERKGLLVRDNSFKSLETRRILSRLNSKIFSKSMREYPADFSRYLSSPGNVGEQSYSSVDISL